MRHRAAVKSFPKLRHTTDGGRTWADYEGEKSFQVSEGDGKGQRVMEIVIVIVMVIVMVMVVVRVMVIVMVRDDPGEDEGRVSTREVRV